MTYRMEHPWYVNAHLRMHALGVSYLLINDNSCYVKFGIKVLIFTTDGIMTSKIQSNRNISGSAGDLVCFQKKI
jgi:hypothetical protein